uniref:ResR2 n=1 Tax=Sarocladium zeae TaxID=1036732 RepID=X4YI61_9HYPO|nr:ResR2 [Sarocladium zeae]
MLIQWSRSWTNGKWGSATWRHGGRSVSAIFDRRVTAAYRTTIRNRRSNTPEYPEEEVFSASNGPGSPKTTSFFGIVSPESSRHEQSPGLDVRKSSQFISPDKYTTPGVYDHPTEEFTQQSQHERLSRYLHGSLPSRRDIERICAASRHVPIFAHELLTLSYPDLVSQQSLRASDGLLDIPPPTAHPIIVARYMLQLVIVLQNLHPELHEAISGLAEPSRLMMERLARLAITHVTTDDSLLAGIEGLQCVMMESMWHANAGRLRRSWLAGRKAMNIAQLMGLNRPNSQAHHYTKLDRKSSYDPQLMWFRIVLLDRHLCLMLGLPEGCHDRSMASDELLENDTPLGRLERTQCVLASRILERNEASSASHQADITSSLDSELQKAARSLPSQWWLTPNLDVASSDPQATFWDTRRLFAQVLHYNLLNQLHLPYMLRGPSSNSNHEYSRITCVTASREVLSRFIILRSFNQVAYSCRTVDFLALMAAMTLLLAHLDSHIHATPSGGNLLAHQYHSDRAMVEQAQEHMKEIHRLNSDVLSAQSADLLAQLLAIDVNSSGDASQKTVRVVGIDQDQTPSDQDERVIASVPIPYFGTIRITREGISKEAPQMQPASSSSSLPRPLHMNTSASTSNVSHHGEAESTTPFFSKPGQVPLSAGVDSETNRLNAPGAPNGSVLPASLPESSLDSIGANADVTSEQLSLFDMEGHQGFFAPIYPGLAAAEQDWALQGVDVTFFDTLLQGL